jgi:lincosamide and streptogramin A transport system ATP-binding/permease protein
MQFASDTGADTMLFCRLCVQTGIAREALYRSMRGFSEGQRKKVSLARSLSERAHLYIWDEPLNYVDNQTRRQLEALLEGTTATLLFVDHDEAFAEKIMTASLRLGAPAR